jgi:hypothetical protein
MLTAIFCAATVAGQQTPEQLCKCAGDDSTRKGGIRTIEEFRKKYGQRLQPSKIDLAWRVYQAANRCDANVVIGRLGDTATFEGKAGYCVLRDLIGYDVPINEVFIYAATDRQARFLLASQQALEKQKIDSALPQDVARDRNRNWQVLYNHEISLIEDTERYRLVGNPDRFSPKTPGAFEPLPCPDLSGSWGGSLVVKDVRGSSNVQVGQSRIANVKLDQTMCRTVLHFGSDISGYLKPANAPPHVSGVLDDSATGPIARAELFAPSQGPLDLTIEQRAPNGATIVSAGKLTKK